MKIGKYNINIPRKDLRRDVFRSGGPGGQAQNKIESGVRWTHLPTGVSAESRSDRSQHANNENAFALLHEKLLRLWLMKQGQSVKDTWLRKPEASFGSQRRTYVLDGHRRCVDHLLDEKFNVDKVLNGQLDPLLDAKLRQDRQEWINGTDGDV
jgi:peptide chain release factor 2